MSDLPTRNICTVGDYADAIYLRAHCMCCSPEHSHEIEVERDEGGTVSVSIYSDLEWAQYRKFNESAIKYLYLRLKNTLQYLITGRVKVENSLLMSERGARDYIAAIEASLQKVKAGTDGKST